MFHRYPRLSAILLTYPVAIFIFAAVGPETMHTLVEPFGVGGILLAGALYTYGFTASAATVILPSFVPDYAPIFIAILGGLGATFADTLIFRFIKGGLKSEIAHIRKVKYIKAFLESPSIRSTTTRNVLGFLIIASPFPDELGVAFLTMTRMKEETFRVLSFGANVLGIYLLASAATLLY